MTGNSSQKPDLAETVVRPANDGLASPEVSLPADDVRENALFAFSELSELDRARVQWVLDVSDSVIMVQAANAAGSNQTEIAVPLLARAKEDAAERFAAYVKTHSVDGASPLHPDELLMLYADFSLHEPKVASISVPDFAGGRRFAHKAFAEFRAASSSSSGSLAMSEEGCESFLAEIPELRARLDYETQKISEDIKKGEHSLFTQGDLVAPSSRRPKEEPSQWQHNLVMAGIFAAAISGAGLLAILAHKNKAGVPATPTPAADVQTREDASSADAHFAKLCSDITRNAEELGKAMKAQGITPTFTYQPQIDSYRFTLERDGKTVCDLTLTPEQVNRIDGTNPQASLHSLLPSVRWSDVSERENIAHVVNSALAVTPPSKITFNGQPLGAEHLGTVSINGNLINRA